MPKLEIQRINTGLGFGEGSITYSERIDQVGEQKIKAVESAINSGELLVPIDTDSDSQVIDDDGCGDGRVVRRIFHGEVEKKHSLRRPKVFGGGPAMAAASIIGLGDAENQGLQELFSNGISSLKASKIDFGGHTDSHSHGPNCGCGALDKAPEVITNVAKYADSIKNSIIGLGEDTTDLDEVLDNYRNYAAKIAEHNADYSGAAVMSEIIESGKIVKELDGTHNEMFIVVNFVDGQTIDQEKVRELSDGDIQVFAVDAWRLYDIADRLYDGEPQATKHQALLGELAYTLGVSATLTKGDLPVYAVTPRTELVTA